MTQILRGQDFFRDRSHAAYQALKHYPSGLMIDAGAASGYTSGMMIRMSPNSRVIAFEPFQGNHKFFEEFIGGDERVTLDKRAVSDQSGTANFNVPSVVVGSEAGWENMAGYSSLGGLGGSGKDNNTFQVETCRLDEIVHERIRFLKIDTQGAELRVLNGCEGLIDQNLIDVMFVEFDGNKDVMRFLIEAGFYILDTECVLTLTGAAEVEERWRVVRESTLSTGKRIKVAWPKPHVSDPYEYCDMLRSERARLGMTWTDLVCVAPHAFEDFQAACKKRDAEVSANFAISMKSKITEPAR